MIRRAVVFALALCLIAPAAAAAPDNSERQTYIVVLKESAGDPGSVASEHSRSQGARVRYVYRHALSGYAAKMSATAAARVANDRRVAYVEADGPVQAIATQTDATWGLDRIDQRDLPLNGTYTYTPTGGGVRAYIIDTGIRSSHKEFSGRMAAGMSVISDGRGTDDCNGHGTHVAGTVGGSVYGVAKGVTLVPVRVLNCQGSGTWSGVIQGINWVTGQKTANPGVPMVANMSLGGGFSSAVNDAVENSSAVGVTHTVAAGNGNNGGKAQDACGYSPASAASALTVGATTSSDAKTSWSNYGTCVDLFAPGASITSAWHDSNTATRTISGTSMAAPHVAGVAALYLQNNTGAGATAVASAVTSTATPNKVSGAGPGSPNLLLYSPLTGGGVTPPANTAPTAESVSVTTDEGVPVTVTLRGTDAEQCQLTFSIASGPSKGSLGSISNNNCSGSGPYADTATVSYTPSNGATGSDSFTYKVNDGTNDSNAATVSVTVNSTSVTPPPTDLSVTVEQVDRWTSGPWNRTNLRVTVTDGTTSVSGASVALSVYSGDNCSGSPSTGSGTTGSDGTMTFEYRSRTGGPHSAVATASSAGASGTSTCRAFQL